MGTGVGGLTVLGAAGIAKGELGLADRSGVDGAGNVGDIGVETGSCGGGAAIFGAATRAGAGSGLGAGAAAGAAAGDDCVSGARADTAAGKVVGVAGWSLGGDDDSTMDWLAELVRAALTDGASSRECGGPLLLLVPAFHDRRWFCGADDPPP